MEAYKIIAYLNNECTIEENKEVEGWIEGNSDEFNRYKYVWERSQKGFDKMEMNLGNAWRNVNPESRKNREISDSRKANLFKQIARIAAVLIILVSLGYMVYQIGHTSGEIAQLTEISNASGDALLQSLPDGSKIWLNTNTIIKYPKEFGKTRKVYLTGEAYFEVMPDPGKPFEVQSGKTVTKVLGTSFNIDARNINDRVQVDVVSGKVAFYEENKEKEGVILYMGDQAVYNTAIGILAKQNTKDLNFLAWKTHTLIFEKTPLNEVCEVLSDYYNTSLKIGDKLIGDKNLSAVFNDKPIEQVLQVMELTLDIKAVNKNDQIILYLVN